MSLVLYSLVLFYPGGGAAAGALSIVQMHGSNQPPLLFTDSAGTVPAVNPLTADSGGLIKFWAAPGHYMAELAGNWFYVPIDPSYTDPVWQDLWVHTQGVAAAVWTVEHHFGTRPEVDVIAGSGELAAEVSHPDNETTVITFGTPTVGVANLRR